MIDFCSLVVLRITALEEAIALAEADAKSSWGYRHRWRTLWVMKSS
jgi:hypothetical protein